MRLISYHPETTTANCARFRFWIPFTKCNPFVSHSPLNRYLSLSPCFEGWDYIHLFCLVLIFHNSCVWWNWGDIDLYPSSGILVWTCVWTWFSVCKTTTICTFGTGLPFLLCSTVSAPFVLSPKKGKMGNKSLARKDKIIRKAKRLGK